MNLWPETLIPRVLVGRFLRPRSLRDDDTFQATRVDSLPDGISVAAVCALVSADEVNTLSMVDALVASVSADEVNAIAPVNEIPAMAAVASVKSNANALVTGM